MMIDSNRCSLALISALLFICCNCNQEQVQEQTDGAPQVLSEFRGLPQLGDSALPDLQPVLPRTVEWRLTASGSIDSVVAVKWGEMGFDVAYDQTGRVKYLSTNDSGIVSPEGVRVGMSIALAEQLSKSEVIQEPGWAVYVPLKDGWCAASWLGSGGTDDTIDSSQISFFFKRR